MTIDDLAKRLVVLEGAARHAGCKLHAIEISRPDFTEAIYTMDAKLHANKLPMWWSEAYPGRLHFLCGGVIVFPEGN